MKSIYLPLISIICLLLAGCDYQTGGTAVVGGYQWRSIYRTDVQTVCVPIFGNKDFHRGVEFQVSSALVHEIEAVTPYKVVARDHADTIIEGEIVSVKTVPLSLSETTAAPDAQLASVTVNFTWKDLRTGKILVQRSKFEQAAAYYPTLGEESFAGEQDASEKLAAAIVHEMEGAW